MKRLQLVATLLWATWASAQVQTVIDGAGATVVEVLTTNVLGAQVTSVLSTLVGTTTNPLSSSPTRSSTSLLAATSTSSTPQGGGVVEQPAPTEAVTPGGPTPFTYTTTDALGHTTVVEGIFTPTAPATALPTPTTTGTILDYSSWLSMVGTNTVPANAASRVSQPISTGWYCLVVTALASLASGAWVIIS